ncbi:hypothetical protein ACXX82_03635 [Glaciimonas sp. GNP009]
MSKPPITPSDEAEFPEAYHKPFSWLPSHHQTNPHAQFFAMKVDVCEGISTCIDLAHSSNSDRDTDTAPTLDIIATERLLRLALMSSQMLTEMAARRIDGMSDRANVPAASGSPLAS